MRPHLTDEEVALFIEGSYDELNKASVYEHLRGCPQCFEDYKDAAIGRGIWTTEREFFGEQPALVAAGLEFAGGENARVTQPGSQPSAARPWFKKPLRLSLIAAATAIVAVAVVVWFNGGNGGSTRDPIESAAIRAIQEVAKTVSSNSVIVIPGTENFFDPDLPAYRSGLEYNNRLISISLTELVEFHNEGTATRDDRFWLAAGFLSTGQLTPAKKYVDTARSLYPNDTEIGVLNALVFYMDGNLAEAERLLRDIHDVDPGNPVAQINLGGVLLDLNKTIEATELLKDIQERHPNTRLARRAQRLLSND